MKIEIKLNQEQFDLLLTSLVQIAQSSVRMAQAWETSDCQDKKEVAENSDYDPFSVPDKPRKQTWGGNRARFAGYISIAAVCHKLGGGISKASASAACKILGIKTKEFKDSTCLFIPEERRSDLENFLLKIQE